MINKKFIESRGTLDFFFDRFDNEKIIDNFRNLSKHLKISLSKFEYPYPDTNEILIKLFEEYTPKLKNDYQLNNKVAICFLKELINAINDCFFSYSKICIYVEIRNKNQKPQDIFKVNY